MDQVEVTIQDFHIIFCGQHPATPALLHILLVSHMNKNTDIHVVVWQYKLYAYIRKKVKTSADFLCKAQKSKINLQSSY